MATPRDIPSIEQLRQRPSIRALEETHGRDAVLRALRAGADDVRAQLSGGGELLDPGGAIERELPARLREESQRSLRPVINATGVIIHTNLGRAPLAPAAVQAISEVAAGYTQSRIRPRSSVDAATGTSTPSGSSAG